jgi:hypothetical protein
MPFSLWCFAVVVTARQAAGTAWLRGCGLTGDGFTEITGRRERMEAVRDSAPAFVRQVLSLLPAPETPGDRGDTRRGW